ncbi:MAG: SPOR domain-containing protein [Alphaproteobacteria bacterium]|nr:SPOR domain-containing protein [Alphaproteobacteria bacterium]
MSFMKDLSYVFLGAATAMITLPSVSVAMITEEEEFSSNTERSKIHQQSLRDFINDTYRIQLFSLPKEEGKDNAHARLEEMRQKTPKISNQLALLATEKGSKWIRGQIGPFVDKEEATSMKIELREIFTADLPTVSTPGIVHQPGFELEDAEWHNWQ